MTFDIISDLSTLTGIYKYQLEQVADKAQLDMCHCVLETIDSRDKVCVMNVGIGELVVSVDEDGIEYKFIPSKSFEDKLVSTVQSGESPLQASLETKVNSRMLNIYKELL